MRFKLFDFRVCGQAIYFPLQCFQLHMYMYVCMYFGDIFPDCKAMHSKAGYRYMKCILCLLCIRISLIIFMICEFFFFSYAPRLQRINKFHTFQNCSLFVRFALLCSLFCSRFLFFAASILMMATSVFPLASGGKRKGNVEKPKGKPSALAASGAAAVGCGLDWRECSS